MSEQRLIQDPEQQTMAGAVVSIGHDGKLRVERGLLKAEDAKRFAGAQRDDGPLDSPKAPPLHSALLARRLTAHRTRALQATLAGQPMVALAALAHRLALTTFYPYGASALQIKIDETSLQPHAADLPGSKAEVALQAQRDAWRAKLPEETGTLFPWLLGQSCADVLALLAFCVSVSVNGVQSNEAPHAIDGLAQATKLDMHEWWTPTAEGYLGSLPKARILQIVTEAVSVEAAAALGKLKKGPLAAAAELRLVGTGWLPPTLRGAIT